MFEWLERELSAVKTPRFHLVDGPADEKLCCSVLESGLPLPPSYKEFVLKFGNARLYRVARNDSYLIGVFAGPRIRTQKDGSQVCVIGFHDSANVYVDPVADVTFPIFEVELNSVEKVADDFEEWLSSSCASARRTYGKEKWDEILRGPEPFTPEEEVVVETRRKLHWRLLGIDNDGNHMFEVTNTAGRSLPVLTVGLRSRDRMLDGAVSLKVGHISPGETAVIHAGCYKGLILAEEIEAFSLPDPRPEDRDRYHEFG